ncbi:3727_t:CDS:1, partial [Entrophospora sp. SA101]
TDCIWSPEVFSIESYLVQERQPVLYKLYNKPKRSFVREELQIFPLDTMLPPEYILKH